MAPSVVRRILGKVGFAESKSAQLMRDDLVPLSDGVVDRLLYLERLLVRTARVPGDVLECGIGRGNSLLTLALLIRGLESDKHLWGFDSFTGFPEPSDEDRGGKPIFKGYLAIDQAFVEGLLARHIKDAQFLQTRVTLVKGFFEDTLDRFNGRISLLHLDVDLYASYKVCLHKLSPLVSPGGIIAFDEYVEEAHRFPGAARAIDEFLAGTGMAVERDLLSGKHFVVNTGR
jgi:O-methyltransferase